jgi:ribosomal protein L2
MKKLKFFKYSSRGRSSGVLVCRTKGAHKKKLMYRYIDFKLLMFNTYPLIILTVLRNFTRNNFLASIINFSGFFFYILFLINCDFQLFV